MFYECPIPPPHFILFQNFSIFLSCLFTIFGCAAFNASALPPRRRPQQQRRQRRRQSHAGVAGLCIRFALSLSACSLTIQAVSFALFLSLPSCLLACSPCLVLGPLCAFSSPGWPGLACLDFLVFLCRCLLFVCIVRSDYTCQQVSRSNILRGARCACQSSLLLSPLHLLPPQCACGWLVFLAFCVSL